MKFHQTQLFENLNSFVGGMRVNFELLLIFKLIRYFKLKKILEIGFNQGKTFGAMIEAAEDGSELTAVDIKFSREVYDKLYHNTPLTANKKINLLTMSSSNFVDSCNSYDFINVDGDHYMPQVYNDICLASKLIKQTGIIMIDDFIVSDVDLAINMFLQSNANFVPFLMDEQAVFFHHTSHDAAEFLDNELEKIFSTFATLPNITYKSFTVKKINCQLAITENNDIFSLICKRYDL